MDLKPGLLRIEMLDVEATRRQAEQAGFLTFVLPGESIVDQASFFNAVRATLPLDPPLIGIRSWDALSDSLWEGLQAHAAQRIAILWPNTRVMTNSALSDFEIALSVLVDVASSLADPRTTRDNPKEVTLLVELG
jgi:Barstar (barnase inhibitor)